MAAVGDLEEAAAAAEEVIAVVAVEAPPSLEAAIGAAEADLACFAAATEAATTSLAADLRFRIWRVETNPYSRRDDAEVDGRG